MDGLRVNQELRRVLQSFEHRGRRCRATGPAKEKLAALESSEVYTVYVRWEPRGKFRTRRLT